MKNARAITLIIACIACALTLVAQRLGWVTLAAQVVQSWLSDVIAQRPWTRPLLPVQLAFQTVLGFACAFVCAGLPRWSLRLLFIAAVLFLVGTLAVVLHLAQIPFEPISGWLVTVLAGCGVMLVKMTERGSRVDAFSAFFHGRITREKFSELIVHREPVKLSGTREATTLTCRILNFPQLVHQLEPAQLEILTSAFLEQVGQLLTLAGGYLDGTHAQGIVAQFGFPLRSAQHAREACAAALLLKQRCEALSADAEKRWEQRPVIGIGIASGPVACGLMGYAQFQNYSVLGEAVEQSRELCKAAQGQARHVILLAAATREMVLEAFQTQEFAVERLQGVWELVGQAQSNVALV